MPVSDIEIVRDKLFGSCEVSGLTDAGVDFVDAYLPPDAKMMMVDDCGEIVLLNEHRKHFLAECEKRGLTVTQTKKRHA